jgi:hypothetical protein
VGARATRGYASKVRDSTGSGRSWLLIKHRDEWSGDLDIAEFAPRSVKSDRDFPEILAEDSPAIWHSGRPAKGGATGAMLQSIIEEAAKLKADRGPAPTKPVRRATKKKGARK